MKSPSREEVMRCLKSTPKGRLTYNSERSTASSPNSSAGRSSNCTERLVVSLNSPPDERNSQSLSQIHKVVDDEKSPSTCISPTVTSKQSSVEKNHSSRFGHDMKTEKVKSPLQELHVSKHDVIDLIKDCKEELREKVRTEAKAMKDNFIVGIRQIQDELKISEVEVDQMKIAKFNSDAREIAAALTMKKVKDEEALKKLQIQHLNRSKMVLTFNESIQRRQEQIKAERRLLEETQKQRKLLFKKIHSSMNAIRELYIAILEQLESHKDDQYISDEIKSIDSDIRNMYSNAAHIANNALNQQTNLEETCSFLEKSTETLSSCKEKINDDIAKSIVRKAKEDEMKENEKKIAEAEALEAKKLELERKKQQEAATAGNQVASTGQKATLPFGTGAFVASEAYEIYKGTMSFKEQVVASYAPLLEAKEKKMYRFDLTKAINTPINAISDQSPVHLIDKIKRLSILLNGEQVDIGSKKVSSKDLPEGLAYCKDTVAKKLVLQGARQISSSFNSAFSFGAVSLGIWAQFPEVGKLILAHFYVSCPYLVPFYVPKKPEQSTAEYCKVLGYEVTGEEVESEDKYLKKLSGIVRLYAAILQSPMPPSMSSLSHPYGLHNGWTWLSRIINLEPRETVTATILFDFLEVAGYAMSQEYGKQFKKLLQTLCQEFVPKIDQVTATDQKGPVMRLKMFLEKCVRSENFPVPDGYLSSRWWKGGGGMPSF